MGNKSEFSLGYTNPEHAVVEKSDKNKSLEFKNSEHAVDEISEKNKSLGIKNPERAVVEKSDKNKSLEFKNSKHAVVELSDNQKINNIKISSADQRKDLENEILNFINEEHSKINMQIPFRTHYAVK